MLLSKPQVQRFWREWSAACRYQKWEALPSAEKDAKRKELLARCGFNSLTLVDRVKGFSRVLEELAPLQDNVTNTVHATENPRRVLLFQVSALADQLGLNYAISICRDRFGMNDIESLTDHQLEQMRNTLNARAHSKRRSSRAAVARCSKIHAVNFFGFAEETPF
jgi:hypothetical protein